MKKALLAPELIEIIIHRLSRELIESYNDFTDTVIIGLQPRGIHFSNQLVNRLSSILNIDVPYGKLDVTFHRDDIHKRKSLLTANETDIPFVLEDKKVILIDDVLYTGRSVRAAMDAMLAFGRPSSVELLVLIDRKYTRELPIEAHYVGKAINSMISQRVIVEWGKQKEENMVWLVDQENE